MGRTHLIDSIASFGNEIVPVLMGLETEQLERIERWYETKDEKRKGDETRMDIAELNRLMTTADEDEREAFHQAVREQVLSEASHLLLEGEGYPYNVYLIEWEDGCAYVGMTSKSILERMTSHFATIDLGIGSLGFVQRWGAGVAYRFRCLHTNLSESDARWLEIQEISARQNLINVMHNDNPVRLKNTPADAERGAVARFFEKGRR